MFQGVLIVCTGNICRSPLAAGLLAARRPDLDVASAGTRAPAGVPADPLAIASAQARGVDLSAHRARRVDAGCLAGRDLVLTAAQSHRDTLLAEIPASRGRVFRLGHWRDLDIPDPIGCDAETFEQVAALIDDCLADWLPQLGTGDTRNAAV